jgi:hypothetical protein
MMPTVMSEETYNAYLVRIWRDDSRGRWRAQVVPVGAPGSNGRFFTDPAQLLVYWLGETGVTDASNTSEPDKDRGA